MLAGLALLALAAVGTAADTKGATTPVTDMIEKVRALSGLGWERRDEGERGTERLGDDRGGRTAVARKDEDADG